MDSWNEVSSRYEIRSAESFGFFVPRSAPTYSVCRKHVDSMTPVDGSVIGVSEYTISAGGLEP